MHPEPSTLNPSHSRLLLVDAMGMLYRAFYAIRELSTRAGRPTNALYGFIRMLRQLVQTRRPTHALVVFDGGLSEERLELLETYKAQRPPMPDDLKSQIALAERFLDCSRIVRVRVEGQEADDVLATVARSEPARAGEVLIATSDKDLFQLVDDTTRIIPPAKAGECLGPDEIRAKTGVGPDRIVEWLALAGDNSDNIPGVPGVGAKTAAKLLGAYGSLDQIWARIDEVPSPKLRTALLENRDAVTRNLEMVRLRTDLLCPVAWDELALQQPDAGRLLAFFEEMEFESLAKDLREPGLGI
ncbi:MAG: hypothetical protein JXR37_33380 [Kiritimatiellae bacterium]|nr:hypothetical protein [Kiritimatiellia bacterium]